jgi:hypothetical protein
VLSDMAFGQQSCGSEKGEERERERNFAFLAVTFFRSFPFLSLRPSLATTTQ